MCANLTSDVLSKIEKALSEMSYYDAVQNSSRYNNQLVLDRKTRLPFIDSQTGVAQRDCCLWMQKWERMPGTNYGQLYTYPSRRWKKKRRGYLLNDNYFFKRNRAIESQESNHVNGVENQSKPDNPESSEKLIETITKNESKDAWIYADYDDSFDFEDDFDIPESDYDDSEEFSIGRKKKRKKESVKKKKGEHGDVEKPYICDVCDARYKTRPGLTYHYTHTHQNSADSEKPVKSIPEDEDSRQSRNNHSSSSNNAPNPTNSSKNTPETSSNSDNGKEGDKSGATPSPYCDFCLGDSEENKKSKSAEKLISCSDCGRSAHPTCLQFTPQMILAIQKYRWQCIECKSCGMCGTSDNDEQLLFCDDCDRGYHMYCLTPPLSEPPEGSWSCHLCIEEYHTPKKKSES